MITPFNSYKLAYSMSSIKLASSHYKFSSTSKKCNRRLMVAFVSKIDKILSSNILNQSKGTKPLTIVLEGKYYYARKDSRLGVSLLKLPKQVRAFKIKEKMMCN
ncbi:MAG: hypothetical protein KAG61_01810 [Bacteriovoracaceae bacterium]|nr:hypothetical protein [Bacteriovoracaceae bacterium]